MCSYLPTSAAVLLVLLAVAGCQGQQLPPRRPGEYGSGSAGWRDGQQLPQGRPPEFGSGPGGYRDVSAPGLGPASGSRPPSPGAGLSPTGPVQAQPGLGPARPGPGSPPGAQGQQPFSPSGERRPPPPYSPGRGPGLPGPALPAAPAQAKMGEGRLAADGRPGADRSSGMAADRSRPPSPPAAGQQPRPIAGPTAPSGAGAAATAPAAGGAGRNVTGPARVVCYYTNTAQKRAYPSMFYPEDIDPNMCTHINFAFARVSQHALMPTMWNDVDNYARIQNLKLKNPNLKVLLSVGGWNHGTRNFTEVAYTPSSRATFVQNVVAYLKQYGFDGLDLVWMYPGAADSPPEDKKRFTFLVQELRNTFDHEASMSGKVGLLLTAAVSANEVVVNRAYEIDRLAECLDWINLMTYDMRTANQTLSVLPHSSLYGPPGDPFTVDYAVRMWIYNGMPPKKVVVGVPMYGRSYRLAAAADHDVNANAVGAGDLGWFTVSPGFLSYFEICQDRDFLRNEMFDMLRRVPYSWNRKLDWIGYESPRSMIEKCHFIQGGGLGGAMVWTLDLDDFAGSFCNAGKYPLLRELSSCLTMSLSSRYQTGVGKQTGDTPTTSHLYPQSALPGVGPSQSKQQQLQQLQLQQQQQPPPQQQQQQLLQQQLHPLPEQQQQPGLHLPGVRPLQAPGAAQTGTAHGEPTKPLWEKEVQEGKIIGAAKVSAVLLQDDATKLVDELQSFDKHRGKKPLLSVLEALGARKESQLAGCSEVFICPGSANTSENIYADPCDCTKFYECSDSVAVRRSCPKLWAWEPSSKRCKHYKEVTTCQIDITVV